MFLAAGELIEAISGRAWDSFIDDRIFTPLRMARSNTSVQDLTELKNVAALHMVVGENVSPIAYRNMDNTGPAGSINSSVAEMAQWIRFQLNSAEFDGAQLLSKDAFEANPAVD